MKTGYRIQNSACTAGICMGSLKFVRLKFGVLIFLPLGRKGKEDMNYTYEFCNGEKITEELDEYWVNLLEDFDRVEENGDRKERYHCMCSLDGSEYEGETFADESLEPYNLIEQSMNRRKMRRKLNKALKKLTDKQRRRLELYAGGMSSREIAEREGCDHKAVLKSLSQARKKLEKDLMDLNKYRSFFKRIPERGIYKKIRKIK